MKAVNSAPSDRPMASRLRRISTLDVRIGFRDGTENLSCTGFGFDVANPHLQMTLSHPHNSG